MRAESSIAWRARPEGGLREDRVPAVTLWLDAVGERLPRKLLFFLPSGKEAREVQFTKFRKVQGQEGRRRDGDPRPLRAQTQSSRGSSTSTSSRRRSTTVFTPEGAEIRWLAGGDPTSGRGVLQEPAVQQPQQLHRDGITSPSACSAPAGRGGRARRAAPTPARARGRARDPRASRPRTSRSASASPATPRPRPRGAGAR